MVKQMASFRSCVCFVYVCMLLWFSKAMTTLNCMVSQTETISSHQGLSTTINCHYDKNNTQYLHASLRKENSLCSYIYFNTSWSKQYCNGNLRFVWIPETKEISFQLLNLQFNHSGVYTCAVENYVPPPTRCLGQKRIFIDVKAPPSVSIACTKGTDGALTMLCTSEGFYPDDLKQAWLRDGEYISDLNTSRRMLDKESLNSSHASWNYSKNTDGTYSFTSSLHLSDSKGVYYCWVNHSTLSHPITLSSNECYEKDDTLPGVFLSVTGISCGAMAGIGVILAACYQRFRKRNYFQSPVIEAPLPEPVYDSTAGNHQTVPQMYSTLGNPQPVLQVYSALSNKQPVSQVYSTIGNHQPVPCRNTSSDGASSL